MSTRRRAPGPAEAPRRPLDKGISGPLRATFERASALASSDRLIGLFTALVLIGALLLIVAEFVDLYHVKQGAIVVFDKTGGSHHSYALLVMGIAVAGAAFVARAAEAWPPAAGIVVLSLIALGIILIGDLPDATSSGLTANLQNGKADPASGLWLELGGALCALGSGVALTYLLRSELPAEVEATEGRRPGPPAPDRRRSRAHRPDQSL